MEAPLYFVQADTNTMLKVELSRLNSGSAVDLTLASAVNLYVKRRLYDAVLFTVSGQINDPTGGEVIFVFDEGQLDIASGEYTGEVEVIFLNGNRETVYEIVDIIIREDYA